MLLIKPKDTRFHKRRLKSNLSFLRLSLFDQFIRLMKGSITGMKDYSWSINCSAVVTEIMLEIIVPQLDQEKTTNYHKNH